MDNLYDRANNFCHFGLFWDHHHHMSVLGYHSQLFYAWLIIVQEEIEATMWVDLTLEAKSNNRDMWALYHCFKDSRFFVVVYDQI